MKKAYVWGLIFAFIVAFGMAGWVVLKSIRSASYFPEIVSLIESKTGYEIQAGEVAGIGWRELSVDGLAVSGPFQQSTPGQPWFQANEATLSLGGWNPYGAGLRIDASVENPILDLKHDPLLGWNFSPQEDEESGHKIRSGYQDRNGDAKEGGTYELDLRTTNLRGVLEHEDWGNWRFGFPDEARWRFETLTGRNAVSVEGKGEVSLEGLPHPPLRKSMFRLLGLDDNAGEAIASKGRFSIKGRISDSGWSVETIEGEPARFEWDSGRTEWDGVRLKGRFGHSGGAEVEAFTAERFEVALPDWNHPFFRQLEAPWSSPPEGGFHLVCRELRHSATETSFQLSDLQISGATLAMWKMPWLAILSTTETWRLEHIRLSTRLKVAEGGKSIEWREGALRFAEGEGGLVQSSGWVEYEDEWRWRISVDVTDFPVSASILEEGATPLGKLSGQMQWGAVGSPGSESRWEGEGSVILEGGRLGGVRLIRALKDLFHDNKIWESHFDRFAFDFDWRKERLSISNLRLDSPVLALSGHGAYMPDGQVIVSLEAKPGPGLGEFTQSPELKDFFMSAARKKPLQVEITGFLDRPSYRVTTTESLRIPIGDLKF